MESVTYSGSKDDKEKAEGSSSSSNSARASGKGTKEGTYTSVDKQGHQAGLNNSGSSGGSRFQWLKRLNLPKGSPPLFFDELGLDAKNTLAKGFQAGQSASVSTLTPLGIMLTSVATKMDDLVLGLITATLVPKPGVVAELTTASTGFVQAALTAQDVYPGLTAQIQTSVPTPKSGKATFKYRHQHFTMAATTGLYAKPPLELSATVGGLQGDVTMGVQGTYEMETRQWSKGLAAVGIAQGNVSAAAFFDLQSHQAVEMVLSQSVNEDLQIAMQYSKGLSKDVQDSISYGASMKIDPTTMVKAKVDSLGVIAGLLQHEFKPNSTISLTAEHDTKKMEDGQAKSPKIGISVNFMPS